MQEESKGIMLPPHLQTSPESGMPESAVRNITSTVEVVLRLSLRHQTTRQKDTVLEMQTARAEAYSESVKTLTVVLGSVSEDFELKNVRLVECNAHYTKEEIERLRAQYREEMGE